MIRDFLILPDTVSASATVFRAKINAKPKDMNQRAKFDKNVHPLIASASFIAAIVSPSKLSILTSNGKPPV